MSGRSFSPPPRRPYYDYPHHASPHHAPYPDHRRPSYHHGSSADLHPSQGRVDVMSPSSASAFQAAPYAQQQPPTNSLPPAVQRPMHQLVPEQQLQLANVHRFTPSCSRCRQKKLKCDTNLPCNQCIAKGVHDECRKDPRVPRGRKRPKLAASASSDNPEDEVATLRKRVEELERMLAQGSQSGIAPTRAPSSSASRHSSSDKPALSSHKLGTSSRASHTSAPSVVENSHLRDRYSPTAASFDSDEDEPGETETSLVTLEKLAASDPRVSEPGHGKAMHKHINSVTSGRISTRGSHAYFSTPAALNERIEILKLAKRLLPEKHIIDALIYAFDLRCHNLAGRIIHMPSFRKDVDFLTAATVEELLTSPLDMHDLARALMVLRLGMRFYPWKGNMFVDETAPEFIAINALKNRGDDISLQWLGVAKRALALERTFSLASLKAIQAALLMILDGRDSAAYLRMLLRISIQTALDMGLHRLGTAMPSAKNPEDDIIQLESGVRIWWYLVVKDWCSAQREGAYTIHPTQMTTRKPLHTTDVRLSEGLTDEISRDDHCETSYTLCQIELANIIRESIDLRNEQSTLGGVYDVISPINKKLLHVKLETFLSDLPPFYRLESNEMRPGVLAVQRALLHQQTFDVLLKLNRRSLSSYSERATCTMLAEQIVTSQKLLRSVCPVIDGFWVNFLHLFGATLTLTISLLLDHDMTAETRERRRRKVQAALSAMRETPGSDRGSSIIETLLQEEQKQWDSSQKPTSDTAAPCKSLDLAALTRQIIARMSEMPDVPGRFDGNGLGSVPIEGSSPSSDFATANTRARDATTLLWDLTPDESIVPAFASAWGTGMTDLVDPTDPTGILNWVAPPSHPAANGLHPNGSIFAQNQDQRPFARPYEHSLRPWQEPSGSAAHTATAGHANENNLWDWVFSQAALLNGPDPPVEGPPQSASSAKGPGSAGRSSKGPPTPPARPAENALRRTSASHTNAPSQVPRDESPQNGRFPLPSVLSPLPSEPSIAAAVPPEALTRNPSLYAPSRPWPGPHRPEH